MWHVWEREELHIGFWWGNFRERYHLESQRLDGKLILKWMFKKWVGAMDCIVVARDEDR
jgi:hypothetical protein